MKHIFGKMRSRGVAVKTVVAGAVMASAAGANAALPAWANDLSTDVGTAITDTATAIGPLVIASLIAVITIKLIKRFANKI